MAWRSAGPAGQLAAWLEIRSDNTILVRTGRTETGTGMSGYYTQAVAEELNMRPELISLLMGDTDRTPDGGYSAGFLFGMHNVRKVAAYTYQALLGLAATQLGVPVSSLTVVDGVVIGGGKRITYGQLVQNQHLEIFRRHGHTRPSDSVDPCLRHHATQPTTQCTQPDDSQNK